MRDSIGKIVKDYEEWVTKTRFPSDKFLIGLLVSSGLLIFYFRENYKEWYFLILIFVCFSSLSEVYKRIGHRDGYIDGFQTGYEDGKLDAMGIDEEGERFIEEMKVDQYISEKKSKENKT